jgi:cell division protein FtsL
MSAARAARLATPVPGRGAPRPVRGARPPVLGARASTGAPLRPRALPPSPPRPAQPAARPGARWLPFAVTAFLLVGSLVLAIVSLQAVLAQGSFRMRELARRTAQLRAAHERLELEVASLSAPGRIAREARRLGLVLPEPDSVRVLTLPGRGQGEGGP